MRLNLLDGNGALVASKVVSSLEDARSFMAVIAEVIGYTPVPVMDRIWKEELC